MKEKTRANVKKPTVKQMLAIGRRVRKEIKSPIVDHAELLYDDRGLPKREKAR
jgi:hypothetical protein